MAWKLILPSIQTPTVKTGFPRDIIPGLAAVTWSTGGPINDDLIKIIGKIDRDQIRQAGYFYIILKACIIYWSL